MANKIDWKKVNEELEKDGGIRVRKMYGYPEVYDAFESVYAPGVELQPKWDIPKNIAITAAVVGAFNSTKSNPNQPITVEQIKKEAFEVLDAGVANVHLHVRDESNEVNVLDVDLFHQVIDPIREKYPQAVVCGCAIANNEGDWEKIEHLIKDGLLDQTPVNTTATYMGDFLGAKAPHAMIKKVDMCQKYGVKAQIACYTDGDIDNARRYLIAPGLIEKPYYWVLLPGLAGCGPMYSPTSMVDTLMNWVRKIREIDADSEIMVCSCGRASNYLTAAAMALGLHVRVGMEDTVFKYPHSDEVIKRNLDVYNDTVTMARILGREPYTPKDYIKKFGLKRRIDQLNK